MHSLQDKVNSRETLEPLSVSKQYIWTVRTWCVWTVLNSTPFPLCFLESRMDHVHMLYHTYVHMLHALIRVWIHPFAPDSLFSFSPPFPSAPIPLSFSISISLPVPSQANCHDLGHWRPLVAKNTLLRTYYLCSHVPLFSLCALICFPLCALTCFPLCALTCFALCDCHLSLLAGYKYLASFCEPLSGC